MRDEPKPFQELEFSILRSIEEMTLRRMARESVRSHPFPWQFVRERYENNYLVQQFTEQMVQDAIIADLESCSVDIIAIDAGMKRARGRMLAAAKQNGVDVSKIVGFRAGGIPAGHADLTATLAPSGRGLFIEVKAPAWIDPANQSRIISEAGKPSVEQLTFLDSKHSRGAIVMIAWSVDDVRRHLGLLAEDNHAALGRFR